MNPILALTVFLLAASLCLAEVLSLRAHSAKDLVPHVNTHRPRSFDATDDVELLDIVLVASVDGKLHALNRTSGVPLWSMASSGSAPAAFGPLVRTEHPDIDPDLTDDDDVRREIYVIEPQSGDIFVMSSPNSPLQRLPFSMSQLVDMSPYRFTGDGDKRVFVGSKESSLLLIELETGKVKATVDPKCPWQPFEDIIESQDIDLDELDGTKPARDMTPPREVYIGRTG